MGYVTLKEYWMGRDKEYANQLTPEIVKNAEWLLYQVNLLGKFWKEPFIVTSGWRPPQENKKANGAKKSNHLRGLAIDLRDTAGDLDELLFAEQDILLQCGLYLEHPNSTPGWAHLQCVPPASRRRVFSVD